MSYAEERNTVWIIEVRNRNKNGSIWNLTWFATGMQWHMTRRSATADMKKLNNEYQEYRVRRYVRKP